MAPYFCGLKRYYKILFLSSVFIGLFLFGQAQRLDYNLKAAGVKLGGFKLEKHVFNDTTIYLLKSTVSINLIFTKHVVDYSSLTTYYKGILIEARVIAIENGELGKNTITKRVPKGYHVSKYEEEEKKEFDFSHSGIKYSSTRLFFEKPILSDSSYAELYGTFGFFSEEKTNEVIITNQATGSETVYFYMNSTPVKRKIEYPIVDFVMYLVSIKPVIKTKKEIYLEYFGEKRN